MTSVEIVRCADTDVTIEVYRIEGAQAYGPLEAGDALPGLVSIAVKPSEPVPAGDCRWSEQVLHGFRELSAASSNALDARPFTLDPECFDANQTKFSFRDALANLLL
jgi:hypothetical protein